MLTHEPEMSFARHHIAKVKISILVMVISGDGELFTSAPICVVGEMDRRNHFINMFKSITWNETELVLDYYAPKDFTN